MKRLVKTYLPPYWGMIGTALALMGVAAATTALIAKLVQPILDDVLNGSKTHLILPVACIVLVTFMVRGISTYLHTIIMNKVGQSIVADIQKHLFSHFMTLDLAFFHANPSGQLISRVISDVNVMRVAVTDSSTGAGKSFLTLIFLIGVMVYQDWKLSLVAFAILPFASGFVAYIGKRLRKLSGSIQAETAFLSDRLSQIFQGIRQVFAYNMQDHERGRANEAITRVTKLNMKSVRISNMSTPVNETLVGLVFFAIIIYGGYEAAAGRMTAGQLASFFAAFTLAYEPMKKLARLNNSLQTSLGAAQRVFDMLDLKPSVRDSEGSRDIAVPRPEIRFENVSFSYENSVAKALHEISFTAEPGKVTALVGPSGGGKTTIINLIPRLYDTGAGRIFIGGHKIDDFTIASLRSQIAFVSQDITMFDDTIASNIAYGRPGASQEEIQDAARQAAAHDFIMGFPDGYQTKVGEDGVRLSGGQKQRLSIARAILRDAPILLLDEATSALDNESEKIVQEALANLEKGRTTLVIAHRLSTVRAADQIIVLDRGKIAESGVHADLMAQNGLYARMYETGLKE